MASGRERHVQRGLHEKLRSEPEELSRQVAPRSQVTEVEILHRRTLHQDDMGNGFAATDVRNQWDSALSRRSIRWRNTYDGRTGVEIGHPVGLHYHYGTLGQLQHGDNYAAAYLHRGQAQAPRATAEALAVQKGARSTCSSSPASHRGRTGIRAGRAKLGQADLLKDNPGIAFKYNLGGGYRKSDGREPLGQAGLRHIWAGAEFRRCYRPSVWAMAIAKFTHSGSQIIDWTPEGSMARSRHIYPEFVKFIQQSIRELEAKGHKVRLRNRLSSRQ